MDVLCILEPTEKLLARLFSRKKKKKSGSMMIHIKIRLLLEVLVWHGNNQAANS